LILVAAALMVRVVAWLSAAGVAGTEMRTRKGWVLLQKVPLWQLLLWQALRQWQILLLEWH
jgi:hypothetical protein